MSRQLVAFPVSLALAAAAAPAAAHHGFGTFDRNAEVEIAGTVTGLDWVNPHAWLYMEVARGGETVPYRCEMRAATVLRRSGWSPDMFPDGERITIHGYGDRNDDNSCYVESVTFADGSSIDRYGQRKAPAPYQDPASREPQLASGEPNITGDWAQEQYVVAAGRLVPVSEVDSATEDPEAPFSPWTTDEVEMTPLGEQAAADFDLRSRDNPRMRCEMTSILFDWVFDGPVNRITQHEDRIVLEYGRYGFTRTIHMNQDAHPGNLEPSRGGHSIGRWEGDTLVVDTVGFAPGLIAPPVFHGEKLHVVERFTLDPESWTITREYEATDPDYFTDTYEGSDVVGLADVPYSPDECRELTFVDYGEQASSASREQEAAAEDDASPWWKFWD